MTAEVGAYLGLVEHDWEAANVTHFELNHLFEVSLPTLEAGKNPLSREAHLRFFWADRDELNRHGLEPYPLRHLLEGATPPLWASTLLEGASAASDR